MRQSEFLDLIDRLPPTKESLERLLRMREQVASKDLSAARLDDALARSREHCSTLIGFVREAWHVLEPATPYVYCWHHEAMCEHLEAITRGEIKRLQINQPPGTMKSLISSVIWEAWEWTHTPSMRYLTTSYQDTYVRRDCRKHRDLVMSEWYQMRWPTVRITRDSEKDFENTDRGGRLGMPFASLTAGRGNRVVIDDPHSTEEVESDADRERAARIFTESVPSRVNDPEKDAIIVNMHRLHPGDLCGIIEEKGLPYVKLVIPMEYFRSVQVLTPFYKDPRTEDGELLCEHRISRTSVEQTKLEVGPHAYATQFQQQPKAREGAYFFKMEHILEEVLVGEEKQRVPLDYPKPCEAVFAVVDSASKTGKQNDATGVTYYALVSYPVKKVVVLDWDITQIEANLLVAWLPSVFKRLEELANQCSATLGSLGAFVEDKDSGVTIIQHAQSPENGWPVHAIPHKITQAGKDGRAISCSGYVFKGLVRISKYAHEKTVMYKGKDKNHLEYQVTNYRIGYGTPTDEDELFDCFCYGAAIAFGDREGF